ncbi:MAG: hypothetical protein WKF41_03150 [Gaiellaceae bacterium]
MAAQPYPQIQPYLLYEDVAGAIAWLTEAFGFEEQLRFADEEGTVSHAELRLPGGGVVFLGDPGEDEQARAAGAEIRQEPMDMPYGDRRYDAYDLEGQLWSFAQHVADVVPEDWGVKPGE